MYRPPPGRGNSGPALVKPLPGDPLLGGTSLLLVLGFSEVNLWIPNKLKRSNVK